MPKLTAVGDDFMGLSSDLLGRFREGDPTITAARGHLESVLNTDAANNPFLNDMLDLSNDRVRNQLQAQMGTRGQTGGSDYYGLIGRELAKNETGLRYADYNNAMDRKDRAAGMAPGVIAGEYLPVSAAMEAGTQGAMLPLQGALANAAGTGGLLGQYQTVKGTQKQSSGFGGLMGGLLGSALSGWASGGFKI